jgi:hypothetical protein
MVINLVVIFSAVSTLVVWSLPLLAAVQGPDSSPTAAMLFVRSDEQAAFDWLRANRSPQTVVLASPRVGLLLPGQTGARSYYGHPFETLDAATKKAQTEAFFRGELDTPPPPADIIFYGPTERALGQPPSLQRLTPIFESGQVSLYQINR